MTTPHEPVAMRGYYQCAACGLRIDQDDLHGRWVTVDGENPACGGTDAS